MCKLFLLKWYFQKLKGAIACTLFKFRKLTLAHPKNSAMGVVFHSSVWTEFVSTPFFFFFLFCQTAIQNTLQRNTKSVCLLGKNYILPVFLNKKQTAVTERHRMFLKIKTAQNKNATSTFYSPPVLSETEWYITSGKHPVKMLSTPPLASHSSSPDPW